MTLASIRQGVALRRFLGHLFSPPELESSPAEPRELRPGLNHARRVWASRLFFGGQIAVAGLLLALEAPRLSGNPALFVCLVALDIAANRLAFLAYGEILLSGDFAILMAIIILFGTPGI